MTVFIVTLELQAEIDALRAISIDAAAAAMLLLEALQDDADELENLCIPQNHFDYFPAFEVKKFGEAQRRNCNIFILKYWDEYDSLVDYRIFFGFHAQKGTYYGLAITNRSVSYDPGGGAFRDLLDRYAQCDIPRYR